MNTYNKEIKVVAVGAMCLALSLISKSSAVGFIMGALFMTASDQIKNKR
jgi:small-conductance mechanosensitive channel